MFSNRALAPSRNSGTWPISPSFDPLPSAAEPTARSTPRPAAAADGALNCAPKLQRHVHVYLQNCPINPSQPHA
jgi:hypothetical protein